MTNSKRKDQASKASKSGVAARQAKRGTKNKKPKAETESGGGAHDGAPPNGREEGGSSDGGVRMDGGDYMDGVRIQADERKGAEVR